MGRLNTLENAAKTQPVPPSTHVPAQSPTHGQPGVVPQDYLGQQARGKTVQVPPANPDGLRPSNFGQMRFASQLDF